MNKFQHAVLKDVDTSPVLIAKVSTQAITLTRQSLDESSLAYLSYLIYPQTKKQPHQRTPTPPPPPPKNPYLAGACPGIRKKGGPKSESLFFFFFFAFQFFRGGGQLRN